MKKVIIDKRFFDLKKPLSDGLISGLKELSNKKYTIEVEGRDFTQNNILEKTLSLEKIKLKKSNSVNGQNTCSIKIKNKTVVVNGKHKVKSFEKAVEQIVKSSRSSTKQRSTKETNVSLEVSLDGSGKAKIKTGLGFFDHMLEQIAKHANLDLQIICKGDLHVDEHHTVEDVGITLGQALSEALGNKEGIKRYGFFLPMDDSVAACSIDLGGRAYLNYKVEFKREKVGELPTELVKEFFRGLSSGLHANIYIRANGKNDHHKIESIFKAFAKALNEACRLDERSKGNLPTTKGVL